MMLNDKVPLRIVAIVTVLAGALLIAGGLGHLVAVVNVKNAQARPIDFRFVHLLTIGAALLFVGLIDLVTSWRMWRGSKHALLVSAIATVALLAYLAVLLRLPPRGDPILFFLIMQASYLVIASAVAFYVFSRRAAA